MSIIVDGTNGITFPSGISQPSASASLAGLVSFSYYQGSSQSFSSGSAIKITNFTVKDWDTHNYFDTTNNRFLPLIGGYYLISGGVNYTAGTGSNNYLALYKNGSAYKRIIQVNSSVYSLNGTVIVQLNGSTDYVELFQLQLSSTSSSSGDISTYFQGHLLRGL